MQTPRDGRASHLPMKTAYGTSSEPSLQQAQISCASAPRSSYTPSTIPVLRHSRSFITSAKKPSRLPKPNGFRRNNLSFLQSSFASTPSLQAVARPPLDKTASQRQTSSQRSTKSSNRPLEPSTNIPQRPSVADLRQSFEKLTQPCQPSRGGSKPSLNPESSLGEQRKAQDMPLFVPKGYKTLLRKRSSIDQDGGSCSHTPIFGKGHIVDVKPRINATTKLPTLQGLTGTATKNVSSTSLSNGTWSSSLSTEIEMSNIVRRSTRLDPPCRPRSNSIHQEPGYYASLDAAMEELHSSQFCGLQVDGASAGTPRVQSDQSVTSDTLVGSHSDVLATSSDLLQGNIQPTESGGKVSQLRRLFERSSRRFPSPRSFMNFRSTPDLDDECSDALMGEFSSLSSNEPDSPESTHTIARKISVVPSLTTEISVNDFFCDFVGSPSYEESLHISSSPDEIATKVGASPKRESPVKHRIRQFEHLSRESLGAGVMPESHDDARLSSVFRNGNGPNNSKLDAVRSWRPVHKKGVAIWRKISNSFSRSIDSWKDANSYQEHINSGEGPTSTSVIEVYRITDQEKKYNSGHRRLSSGPTRCDFGLDGHFPSKPVQVEEPPSPDVASSGPSTPQGDPDALHKVMLKQSAAERTRRREDEKHQHHHYCRDKKFKALSAVWKGKGKDNHHHQSADPTTNTASEEASSSKKGKWKVYEQR
ncbi:hypothetical protein NPX13_g8925 [Xylaria arbuscula]|uniref:Uncharacterized protein n=1 Tax=Xylaria arbuscula TaxID=114810 RepID=A0A9W8TJP5_9PEZI|nr:hypothetical protein NPX13_g8925 [Xylaria arbuscula]